MADTTHNARAAAWNTSFQKLTELNQKLDQCQPPEREALERAIAEQEEDLLDTPAPSFAAALTKLYLIFGELLGLDAETEAKRLVLEDLEQLIRDSAELLVSDIEPVPCPSGWTRL